MSQQSSPSGNLPYSDFLADEAATTDFARKLAVCLHPGLVVYLEGDLGAGKTTLVRALLRALGHKGPVKSPTYALVEVYVVSSLYWYHFDFYRFNHPEEFVDAGLGEYFRNDSVCLVEWPDKAAVSCRRQTSSSPSVSSNPSMVAMPAKAVASSSAQDLRRVNNV
jgi:tRNA threonylcarbamoyladenosine biosynthesis protein TsaE